VLFLGLFACNQGKRNGATDTAAAIHQWKKQLLASKQIGPPCQFKSLASSEAQQWRNAHPDQLDGLPANDSAIKVVKADLNNDHKNDLLLYFQGVNCTGHNGNPRTYAKIIYANGTRDVHVMSEIIHAIRAKYLSMGKSNPNLEAVTGDYMETTTTINGYHKGITGTFRLYSTGDAHCCPSYSGTYIYRLPEKKVMLQLTDLKP
jgi:hypothetical protein